MSTKSIKATLMRASDWESWSQQFKAQAVALELWNHIDPSQDSPLRRRPQLPPLNRYKRRTPSVEPPTQTQAPAAESAEPAAEPVVQPTLSAADLTDAGLKAYQLDLQAYSFENKLFLEQHAAIQKLKEWVTDSIAPHYFDLACGADETLAIWFKNLKQELGIDDNRSKEKARDQYLRAIQPLKQAKGWESWLENWEKAISLAKKKEVAVPNSTSEWVNDFLNAIKPIMGEWSSNYKMLMYERIKTGQLTFRDLANNFRDEVEQRYPSSLVKIPRVAPGSFGPSYAGQEAPDQGASGDAQQNGAEEDKNKSQRRRRPSKRKNSEDIEPSCAACGLKHRLSDCFYVFPQKAPPWFRPKPELRDEVKDKLTVNIGLQEEVHELKNKRAKYG